MKNLIYILLSLSLCLGVYAADKNKQADKEKPAKADKAKKGKKAKGEEVTVVGALKCAHCDFKIGDKCTAVLKTEKKFKGNESRLYFLKGKAAKTFAKENPKAEKVEASGLAFETDPGEQRFVLKVAKIAEKK
ncbi:uncharacterized protein METZ01_LOCUS380271 [marine metagenome]|uniref:Uncharacterized protein n=1 Tax=marine metagenome TaxID=408172 RepID=A0A382U0D7_9ZZZZ